MTAIYIHVDRIAMCLHAYLINGDGFGAVELFDGREIRKKNSRLGGGVVWLTTLKREHYLVVMQG